MASTITLQNTINWAQPFLGYAPLTIGAALEPAITAANTVMQTILMPPFKWRWNRSNTPPINLTQAVQDYSTSVSNYGNFELASVAFGGQLTFPLEYKSLLDIGVESSRPAFISDQLDDDAGNITFRVLPAPDQVYQLTVTYQETPPKFTSLSQTWDPIPDWMQFVYNWGFLAVMSDFIDQSKAPRFRQLFVGSLLGVSEGLTEADRNLFIRSWLGEIRQETAEGMATQAAWRGRTI